MPIVGPGIGGAAWYSFSSTDLLVSAAGWLSARWEVGGSTGEGRESSGVSTAGLLTGGEARGPGAGGASKMAVLVVSSEAKESELEDDAVDDAREAAVDGVRS